MKYLNNNNEQYIITAMKPNYDIKFYFFDSFKADIAIDSSIAILDMTSKNSAFKDFCTLNNIKYYKVNKNTIFDKIMSLKEEYVLVVKEDNTIITKSLDTEFITAANQSFPNGFFAAVSLPDYYLSELLDFNKNVIYNDCTSRFVNNHVWFGKKVDYITFLSEVCKDDTIVELINTIATDMVSTNDLVEKTYINYRLPADISTYADNENRFITTLDPSTALVTAYAGDELVKTVAKSILPTRHLMLF